MSDHRTLLLIQIRAADDDMADHELECIARRVLRHRVRVVRHIALAEPAQLSWLDGVAGFVIGGSGSYSVHDPRSASWVEPLRHLLDAGLERRIPGFGICFGHQLLGLHLGSPVVTDAAHAEFGTLDLELTDAGHTDPVFAALPARFRAQTGHSDSVVGVPHGVTLLATSSQLNTQAFKVNDAPMWSAQFHPDLTASEARDRYLAYQRSLPKTNEAASLQAAKRFRLGADDATGLLARFLDTAIANPL